MKTRNEAFWLYIRLLFLADKGGVVQRHPPPYVYKKISEINPSKPPFQTSNPTVIVPNETIQNIHAKNPTRENYND